VVITAFGSVESAVEAMRQGAFDYITKPFRAEELLVVLEKAFGQSRLLRENEFLRGEALALRGGQGELVGESPAMREVFALIDRYSPSSSTVLIRGESGTGKELVARAIHQRSPRRERPFICVNCAALSAGLLESELFGHERGAFTGADQKRLGRFELAEGGTLLLDEVSEIEPRLQAKLLRVLQERVFERVGSSRSIRADVRVLATSNRDLELEVRQGRFREDLFFRLNVLAIQLPPLRERRGDLGLLVESLLERQRLRAGGPRRRLDESGSALLESYDWPGNVRELENVLERAAILSDGALIPARALTGLLPRVAAPAAASPLRAAPCPRGTSVVDGLAGLPLREVEKLLIRDALRRHGGHQKRTAKALGIGVRTLRTKIKLWGLREGSDLGAAASNLVAQESAAGGFAHG
jgi:DNA-binding NtrC family response regulator